MTRSNIVVAEVDALRRSGRAAREHAHRDAGSRRVMRRRASVRERPGAMRRRGRRAASTAARRRMSASTNASTSGLSPTSSGRSSDGEVGADPLDARDASSRRRRSRRRAAPRAAARPRPVGCAASPPPACRSAAATRASRRRRRRRRSVARSPTTGTNALELERRCLRVEREDRAEPLRERAHGHRILGAWCGRSRSRSISAAPIGLPEPRVHEALLHRGAVGLVERLPDRRAPCPASPPRDTTR